MELEEIGELQGMIQTLVQEKDRLYYDLAVQIKNELVKMNAHLEAIRSNTGLRISPS